MHFNNVSTDTLLSRVHAPLRHEISTYFRTPIRATEHEKNDQLVKAHNSKLKKLEAKIRNS
jgi:hypothetical protein